MSDTLVITGAVGQGKCLAWLNSEYDALPLDARQGVDRALAGTGCEALLHRAEG